MECEKFGSGQPVIEAEIFGEKTNLAAYLDTRIGMAKDCSFAAGGYYQAKEHLDGSAFAGAIWAEEPKDFSATDLEGKTAHGDLRAENLAKAFRIDGQVIGGWQRSLRRLVERTG
jgi:hypothetical protein